VTALASVTTDALAEPRTQLTARRLSTVFRYPAAAVAAIYIAVLIASAAAAPLVAPSAPEQQDLAHVLAGPSGLHWLGTDRLGRDVFSRLLFGARVTLIDVGVATAVFLVIGVPLGLVAGYRGGWLDRIVVRLADLVLSVPGIVVLLMVVAVFPGNDIATMVMLGIIACPGLLRIVRAATLSIRGQLYVRAAWLSGLGTPAILRRHVIPRVAGPIIVQTSLFAATALLAESGLSFLGLTRPETAGPSWGNMVAEASNAMSQDPWLLVPTGGALMLTVARLRADRRCGPRCDGRPLRDADAAVASRSPYGATQRTTAYGPHDRLGRGAVRRPPGCRAGRGGCASRRRVRHPRG
jgi:peptide/nickel transport system permease protein